jgi:2-succinyl-5-enolpyruvyl-6-hydroxy-3-cyclohexene-1-carboxylate synthase
MTPVSDDERMNPSTALATVIVTALADLGVRQVVLCPGSRSAPLAYALAGAADQHRIRLHVRLDERSAGFLALGLSKADPSTPAAVITTSGTAVANLHPAVLEAAHAGVPLLVISADRPHEMRGTGASQTTDQVRIFGSAVRWFAEIPAPHRGSGQVSAWRNVVARAVAAARGNPGGNPGPIQLNLAFGDPLTPDPQAEDWPESLTGSDGLTAISAAATPVAVRLPPNARTVVLAGDGAGIEAAEVATAMGWPLLAEPSSGARTSDAIGPYRLLLDLPGLGAAVERVVVFGRPTLSRPVNRLLARTDLDVVVVSSRPDWTDAGRGAALVVPAVSTDAGSIDAGSIDAGSIDAGSIDAGSIDAGSTDAGSTDAGLRDAGSRDAGLRDAGLRDDGSVDDVPTVDSEWAAAWRAAGKAAAAAIDRLLDEEAAAGRLTGPMIAREVAAATGPGDVLFAGASNPIRDLDLAAGPFDRAARVLANRGLAGIDGTISTASGVALSRSGGSGGSGAGQVRCLVGDLTFLHDAGGLLIGSLEERAAVQIVVVDDGGGGIFGLLEHGALAARGEGENALFERVFGTPQVADLGVLCAGYGVEHQIVDDVAALRKALADPPPGPSVIQVRVNRAAHRVVAEKLRAAAVAAASGAAE